MRESKPAARTEVLKERRFVFPAVVAMLILATWAFPVVWFEKPRFEGTWFGGATAIPGWNYGELPVKDVAEKILTADQTVCGEFSSTNGERVTVFLASRTSSTENDLQLFAHPPDVCWRAAGFEMLPVSPSVVVLEVHGMKVAFERRVFEKSGRRELVYYTGLISGKPVPFRLAWNERIASEEGGEAAAPGLRSLKRIPQTFWSRKTLAGPKQFVRISTETAGSRVEEADALIKSFVTKWLTPTEFGKGPPAE